MDMISIGQAKPYQTFIQRSARLGQIASLSKSKCMNVCSMLEPYEAIHVCVQFSSVFFFMHILAVDMDVEVLFKLFSINSVANLFLATVFCL